ncbi:hypothetical protein DESC_660092 [Desulfosarcina cetonica]|nr:hypothetical protein DESC_660092 [Desulfosarcina cetonica]
MPFECHNRAYHDCKQASIGRVERDDLTSFPWRYAALTATVKANRIRSGVFRMKGKYANRKAVKQAP